MAAGSARPSVTKEGPVSSNPSEMPYRLCYDAGKQRLRVGHDFIDNVPPTVWQYEVSGKQILLRRQPRVVE